MLGAPVDLGADGGRARDAFADIYERPGHPDQVLATTTGGVEVWGARERIRLIPVDLPVEAPPIRPVVADPTGRWLALNHVDKSVTLWDIDAGTQAGPMPTPGRVRALVGFGPGDTLVVELDSPDLGSARIWDLAERRVLGTLDPPGTAAWEVRTISWSRCWTAPSSPFRSTRDSGTRRCAGSRAVT